MALSFLLVFELAQERVERERRIEAARLAVDGDLHGGARLLNGARGLGIQCTSAARA
jgi:hypothetical protein